MTEPISAASSFTQKLDRFFLIGANRNARLDGVRAIAILLVIAIHSQVHGTIPQEIPLYPRILSMLGWIGVPVFFVLSGYLVGGGLFRSMTESRLDLREFYISRSLRILPAAYAFLVLSSWMRVGWNLATLKNFLFLVNYYKEDAFQGNFYSLCIEEHFYLLLPVTLLLLRKYLRVTTLAQLGRCALVGIVLVSLTRANLALRPWERVDTQQIFRMTHTNLDFLLYGIIAYVVVRQGTLSAKAWLGCFYPFLLLLAYIPLAWVHWETNPVYYRGIFLGCLYPLAALWAFAFVVFALTQDSWLNRLLSSPMMRWIAVLSYPMYLWNEVVLSLPWYHAFLEGSRAVFTNPWVAYLFYMICNVAINAVASLLSFSLIERPFLKWRAKWLGASKPVLA